MTDYLCNFKGPCRDLKQSKRKRIICCLADYGCNQQRLATIVGRPAAKKSQGGRPKL